MAVIRLAPVAPVTSYPHSSMPIASLFRSAAPLWRSLFAVLLASAAAAFAQFPSAADGFDPNLDGNVYAAALQPDGKLILAGQFSLVRPNGSVGVTRNNLARLNADGTVDTTFDPNLNGAVRAIVLQPDGKILIGGDFTTLQPNGAAAAATRNHVARINADGTLDAAFAPSITGSPIAQVYALLLNADGTIFVGGNFTTAAPTAAGASLTRHHLAKFSATGILDPTYDPEPDALVFAIVPHLNGKIVVAGGFASFLANNATSRDTRGRVARLNPNGTLDSEFNTALDNRATALAVQRDGKILVGGDFATAQGIADAAAASHNRLVRLNPDGTVDTTFTGSASGNIAAITIQPDGSILVGGAFGNVWSSGTNVVSRPYAARFKPDGTVDTTFVSGANAIVDAFVFQPDGKLIIGGYFTGVQPVGSTSAVVRNRVARLNPNGSLDATFSLESIGRPLVSAVQKDGKIVIGGTFTTAGGATHNHLARLNADGSVDTSFAPDFNGLVLSLAIQPADQKILVAGTFTTIGGETRNYIARLNPSGTIDSEFNPNVDAQVATVALQSDGKILIGGSFTTIQPIGVASALTRSYFTRLTATGQVDTGFLPNANSTVYAIQVQTDGKILVGGVFTAFTPGVDLTPVSTLNKDGTTTTTTPTGTATARNALARINADGSLDTAFNPVPNSTVNAIQVQSDGKILIAGVFNTLRPNLDITTFQRNRIARLNTDGTVDTTYDPDANNTILSLLLQPDGKALIGGAFTTLTPGGSSSTNPPNYTLRKYAARLNTDGTVDAGFNLDLNEINGNRVDSWSLQPDGKILIGGAFTSLQPIGAPGRVTVNRFVRLTTAGGLDSTFQPGIGGTPSGLVSALVLQPDGKILAAGNFSGIGGATTTNLARFTPQGSVDAGFSTTLAADGAINAVLVRPGVTTVLPQSQGFAWLNPDGTLRASFAPDATSKITGEVDVLAIQPDGSVVAGGTFTTDTGIPGPNLVRFTPSGAIDPNFGPGPNGAVDAIAIQPDGKIVVGGTFTTIASSNRNYIARLNKDGTIDSAFDPHAGGRVNAVAVQADGNIVIGGAFTTLNPNVTTTTTITTVTNTPNAGNSTATKNNTGGGNTTTTVSTVDGTTTTTVVSTNQDDIARNYLARLTSAGKVDTTYNPSPSSTVNALLLQPDGRAIIGGQFTGFQPGATGNVTTRNHLARINTDGSLDTVYDPNANDSISTLALFVDGKVIAGGAFTSVAPNGGGSYTRNYLLRLNTDGSLDQNFDPSPNSLVSSIAVQPDAKIVFSGAFTTVQPNGATTTTVRNHVARVDFSGALDTSFDPNADANANALAVAADGSLILGGNFATLQPVPPLLVGGAFNTIGGLASRGVALLGDDGSVSSLFQPNPNGTVSALLVQPDGKFVIAGSFTNIAGVTRNNLARFNTDYTVDTAFNPPAIGAIAKLVLQPDGKILASGATALARLNADGTRDSTFSSAVTAAGNLALQSDGRILVVGNGSSGGTVVRLNTNGTSDTSFPTITTTAPINALSVQADGTFLIGGAYKNIASGSISYLSHFSANGVLDTAFNAGIDNVVNALAVQTDGRVMLAGNFTSIGGLPRGGLARLAVSGAATQAITATRTSAIWARSGVSTELSSVTFEQSSDATTWTKLGTAGRVAGTANWQLNGLSLPASGLFYLRARGVTPGGAGSSSGTTESAREINLAATPGVGPVPASVPTIEVGGVLIDAATGLVTGQILTGVNASPALTTASIGTVAQAVLLPTTGTASSVRLSNFSARARVSASGVLQTGFAISGTAPRTVLLRAAGPSLGAFGVSGALAAPRLQLLDGAGNLLGANSGWGATAANLAAVSAAAARTGAFPFSASTSADAAMVVTLPPGTYSMLVLDGTGAGGITLAEIYDADSGAGSQIVNLSIRGNVNPGDGAFLSGFVLTGNATQRLLVRGDGPSLTQFGVPGALANPVVSVFTGSGQLLSSNDNWSQTAGDALSLAAAARSVGAYPLAVGSADAALSLTLVPGTYTVQVSSATSATGAALIEVYELP